jgi:hypothetical protein
MKSPLENKILNLINDIETISECIKNKQYIDDLISSKKNRISLEKYLDAYPDKNLDSSLYQLFGYDDECIFRYTYEFMINNLY